MDNFQVNTTELQYEKLCDAHASFNAKTVRPKIHQCNDDFPPVIRVDPSGTNFNIVFRRQPGPRSNPSDVSTRNLDGDTGWNARPSYDHSTRSDPTLRNLHGFACKKIEAGGAIRGSDRNFRLRAYFHYFHTLFMRLSQSPATRAFS